LESGRYISHSAVAKNAHISFATAIGKGASDMQSLFSSANGSRGLKILVIYDETWNFSILTRLEEVLCPFKKEKKGAACIYPFLPCWRTEPPSHKLNVRWAELAPG
jgi:hypothetical protein